MKTDTQIKFDTIVKEGFTPLLKPLSFKKKALNYYRQLSEVGHIINIQKDRYSHRNHIKFRIKYREFLNLNFGRFGMILNIQDKSLITLQNLSVLSVKLLTIYEEEKTYGTRYTTILMNKTHQRNTRRYTTIYSSFL